MFRYKFLNGRVYFIFLGYILKSGISRSCCNFLSNLLRNWQTICQSNCTILTFPPAVQEGFSFSPTLNIFFVFFWFLNYSCSSGCEVVSPYGFGLHFSDDQSINILIQVLLDIFMCSLCINYAFLPQIGIYRRSYWVSKFNSITLFSLAASLYTAHCNTSLNGYTVI